MAVCLYLSPKRREVVVATSGGYDPFPHCGHIRGFEAMKALGDRLVVIVNNDNFLIRKRGFVCTPLKERMEQIKALRVVDEVIAGIDTDDLVCETLRLVKPNIFAKSGDTWDKSNMPKAMIETCKEIGCKIVTSLAMNYPWHSSDTIEKIRRHYDNSSCTLPS